MAWDCLHSSDVVAYCPTYEADQDTRLKDSDEGSEGRLPGERGSTHAHKDATIARLEVHGSRRGLTVLALTTREHRAPLVHLHTRLPALPLSLQLREYNVQLRGTFTQSLAHTVEQ